MNLHEIIHAYLLLSPKSGRAWLRSLVSEAGLDPALVPHIIGAERARLNGLCDPREPRKPEETGRRNQDAARPASGEPLVAGLYTGRMSSVPLTSDSFRLITRVMKVDNWVRVTFTGRNGLHRHTIEGSVVNIGPRFNSFRLHTADVQRRGLDIGPATHNVFTVEILS